MRKNHQFSIAPTPVIDRQAGLLWIIIVKNVAIVRRIDPMKTDAQARKSAVAVLDLEIHRETSNIEKVISTNDGERIPENPRKSVTNRQYFRKVEVEEILRKFRHIQKNFREIDSRLLRMNNSICRCNHLCECHSTIQRIILEWWCTIILWGRWDLNLDWDFRIRTIREFFILIEQRKFVSLTSNISKYILNVTWHNYYSAKNSF